MHFSRLAVDINQQKDYFFAFFMTTFPQYQKSSYLCTRKKET